MKRVVKKLRSNSIYRRLLLWSRRSSLPGLQGLPVYDVAIFFIKQLKNIGFSDRAASISFNLIMALPAGLMFVATLIPYLPDAEAFRTEMLFTLSKIISDAGAYNMVSNIINDFFEPGRTNLLSISFLFGLFFSSNAMIGIMDTFDKSYYEDRKDHLLSKRWTAIKLTLLLILLMFGSGVMLIMQGSVRDFLFRKLHWEFVDMIWLVNLIRWFIIFMLTYFTIAFIYRFAPATITKWKLSSPGAVVATILTILTTWLFSIWVANFGNYNKVYGSIGTVLILLNLVYINSLILIIGFEINVSVARIQQESIERHRQLSLELELDDELD